MAKRDKLRKLSRMFPAPPEITAALDAAAKQDDRSAAILAAAVLDGVLEKVLIKKLARSEPELLNKLFDNRGPMSDMHSRILMSLALGLITQPMEAEMQRVRAIRNVFAHAVSEVTFKTKEVADEVARFKMLTAMKEASPLDISNKKVFVLMVRILCIMLDTQHHEFHGVRLMEP